MKITYEDLSRYQTTEDQLLIKIARKQEDDSSEDNTLKFTLSKSTDAEIKKGIIVCADIDHQSWVGKSCVIPVEGTILFDSFVEVSDANDYEYRIIRTKNVFLIEL